MLKETLTEASVLPGFEGDNKDAVIEKLIELICATGKVKDRNLAAQDIAANEKKMSTGMQHGIAIPHAKSDSVDELTAAVVVTKNPVDFQSMDGKPAQIFIMTLSPKDYSGPHIRFLAEIGKILKSKPMRKRMLLAETPEELLDILLS